MIYTFELRRKDILVERESIRNSITIQGRNGLLDTFFRGAAQNTSWFFGLIGNCSKNHESDEMTHHPGWEEFVNYDSPNRQQWLPAVPENAIVKNITLAVFSFKESIKEPTTINGFFLVSNGVKGGTSGVLWSSAIFKDGPRIIKPGEEMRLSYNYRIPV